MNDTWTEWRYLRRGKHLHLVLSGTSTHCGAACGAMPSWAPGEGWLGTGNQEEYERAATLPKCKRCLQRKFR